MPNLVLVRDARGSLVHVRKRSDGECLGCLETGLFELVKALVLDEERRRERDGVGAKR